MFIKKFASHLNLTDDSIWIMTMMMVGWEYYDSTHSAPCLYLLFTVGKFPRLHRWSRFSRFISMTKQRPREKNTHMAKSSRQAAMPKKYEQYAKD